jgi:hypothetical protein
VQKHAVSNAVKQTGATNQAQKVGSTTGIVSSSTDTAAA